MSVNCDLCGILPLTSCLLTETEMHAHFPLGQQNSANRTIIITDVAVSFPDETEKGKKKPFKDSYHASCKGA